MKTCHNRTDMPQLKEEHYPAFLRFCLKNQVKVRPGLIPPQSVRSLQCPGTWSTFQPSLKSLAKPVLCSGDHIVIDGNTRHREYLRIGALLMPSYTLADMDFVASLKFLMSFPFAYVLAMDGPDKDPNE